MTDPEIKAAWVYAREMWPSFEIPASENERMIKLQVWRDVLGDMASGVVRAAIVRLSAERFPPPPGEIRRAALALLDPDPTPDGDQALAEVYEAIRRVGYVGRPVWSSPAIGAAIDACGGWQETCKSENPEAFRAHFLRLYGSVTTRVEREALMPPSVRELTMGLDLRADRALGSGR